MHQNKSIFSFYFSHKLIDTPTCYYYIVLKIELGLTMQTSSCIQQLTLTPNFLSTHGKHQGVKAHC